jgi:acyl-CoA synthetase (AMP-forming)/AMP-acid ligase II
MQRFDTLRSALDAMGREDRHVTLIDGADSQHSLSFAQLRKRAIGTLGALQRRGLAAGDGVLLFVNDNESFLVTFWACILGGFVPVPVAVGVGDEQRRKLFRIFAQFGRAWVHSDIRTIERLESFASAEGLREQWLLVQSRLLLAGALDVAAAPGRPIVPDRDDIAFVQYSSGSTSEPKGVVLTHRGVMANIGAITEAVQYTDRDIALSWMPLSHDMGLIGFHLNMIACGATHAIMRTDLFARRPLLWLRKAAELRATVLCSPNFGYQHYLTQSELRRPEGLDLSAVRLLFNGAEPISAALCDRFMRAMASNGLGAGTMLAVYGLAEASLAVSIPRPGVGVEVLHLDRNGFRVGDAVRQVGADDPDAVAFVKLGHPVGGVQLRITDDAGTPLGEAVLGHVRIRGENVTRGYYQDDAATARVMSADGWLDTGDLGFLIAGELVITGRAKDVIFVNGQNYYPHDLETVAGRLPGIEAGRVVAVGARNDRTGTEDLVVFALHRGSLEEFVPIARDLRRYINQQTGLQVAHVLPVTRIPKTTSGKVQRHLLAREFEQGLFEGAVAALAPLLSGPEWTQAAVSRSARGTLQQLQEICARLIPDKRVGVETDLFSINLSSLTLARLHEAIDREFPGRLEVADLFDNPTLRELAAFLDGRPT